VIEMHGILVINIIYFYSLQGMVAAALPPLVKEKRKPQTPSYLASSQLYCIQPAESEHIQMTFSQQMASSSMLRPATREPTGASREPKTISL
jgi:hypothetical protein